MMKAVRMVGVGKPLELHEVPIPEIGAGDILVRVRAAGICHSDVHYRAGKSRVDPLPLTLGHEVAGIVEKIGTDVTQVKIGDRVCLHYNICCAACDACRSGDDQFCPKCLMIGHYTDGGYAQYIAVPARNAIPLPAEIPFEQGATLMCASATSYHALRKGRLKAGERFPHGAVAIHARKVDAVAEIRKRAPGGVDVALELIGLPLTIQQSLRSLGNMGRAVVAGITDLPVAIDTYRELLGNERELIGSNDHTLGELPEVVDFARRGLLDTSHVVSRTVPLDAGAINAVLDALENFSNSTVRTVIVP